MSNELSPEQRDLLARLFACELTALRDAAIVAGATQEAVDDIVEARRETLHQQQEQGGSD